MATFPGTNGTNIRMYTSLDDASLPSAASNTNLIVSLAKIKANLPTAKRCIAISDGSVFRGMGEIVLVDDPTTVSIVAADNVGLTWTVTAGGAGNAFCVLTSSAAHGLTSGVCNKSGGLTVANLHTASASSGWAANVLIPINTIDSTTAITTDYPIGALAGTAPVISEATDECKITSFTLPPALATSRVRISSPIAAINSANAKTFKISLGATALWTLTGITNTANSAADFMFYNKNSTAIQETRGSSTSVTQNGNQGALGAATVETSGGAAVVTIYVTPGVVNEPLGIRSLYVIMAY